jgi:hypothetical protein
MDVFFLQARMRLVKQFQFINNELQSLPYPLVSRFTSFQRAISSPEELCHWVKFHADLGHCMLKGILTRALKHESRAKSTDANTLTSWILLDIDGLIGSTPEVALQEIGINSSYIVQYSASAGVKPEKGLSCHLFVLLSDPVEPAQIKEWLIERNITRFPTHISLNKLNESLHWPIDITTCQNDKLIYIAPPVCLPKELDTFQAQGKPRIELISKPNAYFTFPKNPTIILPHVITNLVNSLRSDKKLKPSKLQRIDTVTQLLYSPHPAPAKVTGARVGEEFTHLNLNGGDSWGYYHPTDNPKFIHNFKGEPIYKTSELVPEYWNDLQRAKHEAKASKSKGSGNSPRAILAFRDFATDLYYNGYFDTATNELEIAPCTSKDRLHDFLANNGQPIPESIPDWTCTYNPDSVARVNLSTNTLNWFVPSRFMQLDQSKLPKLTDPPPTILHLIHNVIGNSPDLVEAFLNWCACAFRYRRPNGTAWILQGVPGTGKGMLVNEILRPLFGIDNVAIKRMAELSDKFNDFIEGTLLCFIDEISIGEDKDHDRIVANLKQQITEPIVSIRKMHVSAREISNYTNWLFSTNNKQPIKIEEGDRRYNVGEFCEVMLKDRVDTYWLADQVAKELPDFVAYLLTRKADKRQASMVCSNEAREYMINSSMITADVLAKAINTGDLQKLYEYVDDLSVTADYSRRNKAEAYGRLLEELILTQRDTLLREELAIIYDATVGNVPKEAAKFTQYLGHHEVRLKVVWYKGKSVRGIKVHWVCDPTWLAQTQVELTKSKVIPLIIPTPKVSP